MHSHSRYHPPRMSKWSPTDVALTFFFAALFGAVMYLLTVYDKLH